MAEELGRGSLEDAIAIAFETRRPPRGIRPELTSELDRKDATPVYSTPFGAAGSFEPEFGIDPELVRMLRRSGGGPFTPEGISRGPMDVTESPEGGSANDPMGRLFGSNLGQQMLKNLGERERALRAMDVLATEILAEAVRLGRPELRAKRLLRVARGAVMPPILMALSPHLNHIAESNVASDTTDLPLDLLLHATIQMNPFDSDPDALLLQHIVREQPSAIAELFFVSKPEIVLSRLPAMEPMCVSIPHIRLTAGNQVSTAGILCRDEEGVLGVTGCFHGTGDVGTAVMIDAHQSAVKRADRVQDIVFIPVPNAFASRQLDAKSGPRHAGEPARGEKVRFDGAVNRSKQTRVFSADTGVTRNSPEIQLRMQTDPDTDQGDSGSALINEAGEVLAFAFHRTKRDDYPQFTDWIWAANAINALKVKPLREET